MKVVIIDIIKALPAPADLASSFENFLRVL